MPQKEVGSCRVIPKIVFRPQPNYHDQTPLLQPEPASNSYQWTMGTSDRDTG